MKKWHKWQTLLAACVTASAAIPVAWFTTRKEEAPPEPVTRLFQCFDVTGVVAGGIKARCTQTGAWSPSSNEQGEMSMQLRMGTTVTFWKNKTRLLIDRGGNILDQTLHIDAGREYEVHIVEAVDNGDN